MAKLERYSFGRVFVDGAEETTDLIVLPHRVLRHWWRASSHRLTMEDLAPVLDELPERLVVGTGASGAMQCDPSVLVLLNERGVTVEVMPSERAVQRYSELDPTKTAAALHLTC
jgi:hypothetical protein